MRRGSTGARCRSTPRGGPITSRSSSATGERAVVYLKALPDDPKRLAEVRRLGAEIGRPILLVSSRRRERIETEALRLELTTPAETYRFGDWWALAYSLSP